MRAVDLRLENKSYGICKRSDRRCLVKHAGSETRAWHDLLCFARLDGIRVPRTLSKLADEAFLEYRRDEAYVVGEVFHEPKPLFDPCYIHPQAKSKRKIQRALEARENSGWAGYILRPSTIGGSNV